MLLEVGDGRGDHLERDELVSALLEAGDDLSDEACFEMRERRWFSKKRAAKEGGRWKEVGEEGGRAYRG